MVIRHSSQRRRRVLADERREVASAEVTGSAAQEGQVRSGRAYTAAAARDQQMVVCDLIPQRNLTTLVWCLTSTCFVLAHGALQALYHRLEILRVPIDVSSLDVSRATQLTRFSLSFTLVLAAVYGALTLSLRRHRADDYRGRYRVWYYIIASLLLAAFTIGSGVSHAVVSLSIWLVDLGGMPSGARIVGLIGLGFLIAAVARLWFEMRTSRSATICLLIAALLAIASRALPTLNASATSEELWDFVQVLFEVAAAQTLLLALVFYARRVHLEAQGTVGAVSRKTARKRSKRERNVSAPAAAKSNRRSDDSESVSRGSRDTRMSAGEDAPSSGDAVSDDEPATVKLSRAERRRLRKEKHRQRRAA